MAKHWDDPKIKTIAEAHDSYLKMHHTESEAWRTREKYLQERIDQANELLAARLAELEAP